MSDYMFPVLGGGRVTSRPGFRTSPGGIGSTNHAGLDIAAPTGTGVIAPIGGTVIFSGSRGGFGNFVEVAGSDGYTHRFAHLDSRNVIQGQQVTAGSRLGTVGSTGNSTGPHLHYEIRDKAGSILNPETLLGRKAASTLERAGTAAKDAALDALDSALESLPGIGQIWSGSKAAGIPNIFNAAKGECGLNPVCHLRKWVEESGFFQRLALAILAFIIIAAAMALLGKNVVKGEIGDVVKGSIK